jgi:phytanoyl-CoA hydroxylase
MLSNLAKDTCVALRPEQQHFFDDNGYLILQGLLDQSRVAALKAHIDVLWNERAAGSPFVIDAYIGTVGAYERTYFREVDDSARDLTYKLNDTHLNDRLIQETAADPQLMSILAALLGSPPLVCNTLLFEYGSQQNAHFDTFYMPSKTPNMMAASWIAIDEVTEDNGPLFYYPKSHLIPPFRFANGGLAANDAEAPAADAHIAKIIRDHGLEKATFYPKPGDVLIWHAQLLHGGSVINDPRQTRASLVTHYWTLRDYPDDADRIAVGNGYHLLRKPHQNAISQANKPMIEAFVRNLAISAEDRAMAPAGFDPRRYLLKNIDVFEARVDPYTHYRQHGRHEGRSW